MATQYCASPAFHLKVHTLLLSPTYLITKLEVKLSGLLDRLSSVVTDNLAMMETTLVDILEVAGTYF